ncbi:MAG: acetyl-CoA carboxylase biotin carboxyl carrier protein, partial [Armatimonadota bacterium]
MSELRARIDELVGLMEEFSLDHASLKGPGWSVEFGIHADKGATVIAASTVAPTAAPAPAAKPSKPKPSAPAGTPVTSPMTGIYYSSSSPGAPS